MISISLKTYFLQYDISIPSMPSALQTQPKKRTSGRGSEKNKKAKFCWLALFTGKTWGGKIPRINIGLDSSGCTICINTTTNAEFTGMSGLLRWPMPNLKLRLSWRMTGWLYGIGRVLPCRQQANNLGDIREGINEVNLQALFDISREVIPIGTVGTG